jgi:enediyne biosynthesis protein E4
VSQPFDRTCLVPAPKEPDERLKDWWVENPWLIPLQGKSLSGYERNRVYLNDRGGAFYEISALTGADSDGDARAVVAVDLTGDGMQELIVRQAGGGALLLMENQFPKANWIEVSLRGQKSNRQGIGARVTVEAGGRRIVRELYPQNGFQAQGPAHVQFGLGTARRVDRLSIRWPSGALQEFVNLDVNQHLRITEADARIAVRGSK